MSPLKYINNFSILMTNLQWKKSIHTLVTTGPDLYHWQTAPPLGG